MQAPHPASFSSSSGSSGMVQLFLRRPDEKKQKQALREKFVEIYETLFQGNKGWQDNPVFWDELLLLKVNATFLDACIRESSEEHLLLIKENVRAIFENCVKALHEDSKLRVLHSLQTLEILLRGIFQKKFNNFGFDVINTLCGVQKADTLFQDFIKGLQVVLKTKDTTDGMKAMALDLLIVVATATANLHQNTLLEYLMLVNVFDTIALILYDPHLRSLLAFTAIFLLVLLANYRKYESRNPYLRQLAELKDRDVLEAFATVISSFFNECNTQFAAQNTTRGPGLMSSLGDFFGNMFRTTNGVPSTGPNIVGAVLLCFYELIHQNKAAFLFCIFNPLPEGEKTTDLTSTITLPKKESTSAKPARIGECPVVLQNFLILSWHMFQEVKDTRASCYSKLCLLTLTSLCEDDLVEQLLHDHRHKFPLPIYQPKGRVETQTERPIVCTIIDLVLYFVRNNLKKKLTTDLYCKCLGIVRRILCYEKKSQARLEYPWQELWTTLFAVIKFISIPEMFQRPDILTLCSEIITIFNLFITYGDLFLPKASDYDYLYYELIRESKTIETFYYYVDRTDTSNGLVNYLENMCTIIRHFTSKINQWEVAHSANFISSPAQVLDLIKTNYDTLKLTLQDNLDNYEAYLENPKEVTFFRQLVRTILQDYRASTASSLTGSQPPKPQLPTSPSSSALEADVSALSLSDGEVKTTMNGSRLDPRDKGKQKE